MQHKITVIGTGYVGLVTGTCLADFGLDVMVRNLRNIYRPDMVRDLGFKYFSVGR